MNPTSSALSFLRTFKLFLHIIPINRGMMYMTHLWHIQKSRSYTKTYKGEGEKKKEEQKILNIRKKRKKR